MFASTTRVAPVVTHQWIAFIGEGLRLDLFPSGHSEAKVPGAIS